MKLSQKNHILIFLIMMLLHSFGFAAGMSCRSVLQPQTEAVQKLVIQDAFKQWIIWEQNENIRDFRKPQQALTVWTLKIPSHEIKIEKADSVPESVLKIINEVAGETLWFTHPFNESEAVPFSDRVATLNLNFKFYMTASRSLVLEGLGRTYTIKIPTDHPHGSINPAELEKASTRDDILNAIARTDHIEKVDSSVGQPDSVLMIAKDVLTVSESQSRNGYLIRDLEFMKNGNYFLPAFSLPFVGREIAKINGESAETFWRTHYAKQLGVAKARLLLRYGLRMETPNPQNILIELDRDLKPTGRLVFRDLSDSFFVTDVAQALGFEKQMQADIKADYIPENILKPHWKNSARYLDESSFASYTTLTIKDWELAHDQAYKNEIGRLLNHTIDSAPGSEISETSKLIFSDEGRKLLQNYSRILKSQSQN